MELAIHLFSLTAEIAEIDSTDDRTITSFLHNLLWNKPMVVVYVQQPCVRVRSMTLKTRTDIGINYICIAVNPQFPTIESVCVCPLHAFF